MKFKILLALVAGFLSIYNAQARHYAMSGCGLGSLAFGKDQDRFKQVLSATTNGTAWNQTFGISSGTSNCTNHGVVAKAKEVPFFIEANQVSLAKEMARGKGETLSALGKVMGCSNQDRLSNVLQKNYGTIFSNENLTKGSVTNSITQTVKSDSVLASDCHYVI